MATLFSKELTEKLKPIKHQFFAWNKDHLILSPMVMTRMIDEETVFCARLLVDTDVSYPMIFSIKQNYFDPVKKEFTKTSVKIFRLKEVVNMKRERIGEFNFELVKFKVSVVKEYSSWEEYNFHVQAAKEVSGYSFELLEEQIHNKILDKKMIPRNKNERGFNLKLFEDYSAFILRESSKKIKPLADVA